jgi:hypothetical protein
MGRSTGALGVMLWLAGSGLAGCGSESSAPERDESGQVMASGQVEALEIQVADCFNDAGLDAVEEVTVVPCTDPHDYEVFHVFELADGAYPGVDAIETSWIDGCLARFEAFVGTTFEASLLDISAIYPTEETWNELGDREVLCSVTAVDGSLRTSSARSSGA